MPKVYECCICHKVLNKKPIRLVKQLYASGTYKQYSGVAFYDFCDKCYKPIENYIKKHNKSREDK